ncbi:beta-mannosidase [Sphingobacterium sp. SGG-5]|nr:beta-mannosidase [Sphingobacterium sp. SGG-5]
MFVFFGIPVLIFGCHQDRPLPIDAKATQETRSLHAFLHRLQGEKILFGHQDDLAYGVHWRYQPGKSDVKDVAGDYPAVMGWDIGGIEYRHEVNLDAVPFDLMRRFIISSAREGSINTISWHLGNPATGGSSWDTTVAVTHILPSGSLHGQFVNWLDNVASFLDSLRFEDGTPVPILFRPFHELNGNWFWWCKPFCSKEEYIELWRFTVNYLKDIKGLHHVLYVYNTNNFRDDAEFMERYPGDTYIDVMSFDTYQFLGRENVNSGLLASSQKFKTQLQSNLDVLQYNANRHGKLMALAETGFEAIPDATWWTDVLYDAVKSYNLSYVLVWRNQGLLKNKMHYYAPYPGHISAMDFKNMFKGTKMALQGTLRPLNIYNLSN